MGLECETDLDVGGIHLLHDGVEVDTKQPPEFSDGQSVTAEQAKEEAEADAASSIPTAPHGPIVTQRHCKLD